MEITVERDRLTAVIDGTYRVSGAVTVPQNAYLAFTAGTGGLTDVHTVRNVAITRLPRWASQRLRPALRTGLR